MISGGSPTPSGKGSCPCCHSDPRIGAAGHNPRVDDRRAMDAIFLVLRTGCQWGALDATGICSHSSAHRRFQEWIAAGVFARVWPAGLEEYDRLEGIDWQWLAMDGAMT